MEELNKYVKSNVGCNTESFKYAQKFLPSLATPVIPSKTVIQNPTSDNKKLDLSIFQEFFEACKVGNLEKAQMCIKNRIDVSYNDDSWSVATALMHASKGGHVDIVNVLLRNGANVNSRSKWGLSALSIAAQAGHANVVKLLIEYGAIVNSVDFWSHVPLTKAFDEGHLDVVELLVRSGAILVLPGLSYDLQNYEIVGCTPNKIAILKR
jgi:ankyrin repeat protein